MTNIMDTGNAEHYLWGDGCDGWYFVKTKSLFVIKEKMPRGTKEGLHYHEKAQQFFYVLQGVASFEVEGINYEVSQGRGILIEPGKRHKVSNNSDTELEFIAVSEPEAHGDRINILE